MFPDQKRRAQTAQSAPPSAASVGDVAGGIGSSERRGALQPGRRLGRPEGPPWF